MLMFITVREQFNQLEGGAYTCICICIRVIYTFTYRHQDMN